MPTPTISSSSSQVNDLHHELEIFRASLLVDLKLILQATFREEHDIITELTAGMHPMNCLDQEGPQLHHQKTSAFGEEAEENLTDESAAEFCQRSSGRQSEIVPASYHSEAYANAEKGAPPSDGTRLFGDIEGMLESMEHGASYDVCDFYKTTGCIQRLARNDTFGNLTLFVIAANGIYLGVDSDRNDAVKLNDADLPFQICEHAFCMFFSFELLVRFLAFAEKLNCLKDAWFKFDTFLVTIMVLETWCLPIFYAFVKVDVSSLPTGPLRLLRLARLARMARILKSLPELVTLLKGMFVATRAVSSAMLLLVGAIYVFAIFMFTLLKESPDQGGYWDSLAISMSTLMCNGVFGDSIGSVVRLMINANEIPAIVAFFSFVVIAAVTIMNMLIGVLCEVVGAVANAEKEFGQRHAIKHSLVQLLMKVDLQKTGLFNKEQILSVVRDPDAFNILKDLDIDTSYFADLQDMLFEAAGSNELTLKEVIELLLEFRGQSEVNLRDLICCHNFTRWVIQKEFAGLNTKIAKLEHHMKLSQLSMASPAKQFSASSVHSDAHGDDNPQRVYM